MIRSCAAIGIVLTALQGAAIAETGVLLIGARVLDPSGGQLLNDTAVLILGQRIAQVGPSASIKAPDGAKVQRIELDGLVLIPGLIDLHSHLLLHPYNETSWDDQVLKESTETRTIRAVVAARKTLDAGFTTLRDLGTEGAGFADVALRDAIGQHFIAGPRMFVVTRAIVATGCYGPFGLNPEWHVPRGAQEASGVDEIRKAVREQAAGGADWIKVYADYRRSADREPLPTFSQEELSALVQEASNAGLRVAAHATTQEGISRCVRAGVATIEHGYGASNEVLEMMRSKHVALCPTLAAAEAAAIYDGWRVGKDEHPRIRQAREMFGRALKSGVTVACGSDVGVFAHGDNAREMELMVEYGMTPTQAIAAATSTAAEVLGRSKDLGRIAEGQIADLVAVRGNPLEGIKALRNVALVIKEGQVASDRRR